MKKIYSLILVSVLMAPFLMKNVILISFYIHKDYIAQTLCSEKDVEDSCCKGSCVLSKELKEVDTDKDALPAQLKDTAEIIFVLSEKESNSVVFIEEAGIYNSLYKVMHSDMHLAKLLHPPSMS